MTYQGWLAQRKHWQGWGARDTIWALEWTSQVPGREVFLALTGASENSQNTISALNICKECENVTIHKEISLISLAPEIQKGFSVK